MTLDVSPRNREVGLIATPSGTNTMITHLDRSFLDPGFDQQILARERMRVAILLDRDGFARWANGNASKDEAWEHRRELAERAIRIPGEQIFVIVVPN